MLRNATAASASTFIAVKEAGHDDGNNYDFVAGRKLSSSHCWFYFADFLSLLFFIRTLT